MMQLLKNIVKYEMERHNVVESEQFIHDVASDLKKALDHLRENPDSEGLRGAVLCVNTKSLRYYFCPFDILQTPHDQLAMALDFQELTLDQWLDKKLELDVNTSGQTVIHDTLKDD